MQELSLAGIVQQELSLAGILPAPDMPGSFCCLCCRCLRCGVCNVGYACVPLGKKASAGEIPALSKLCLHPSGKVWGLFVLELGTALSGFFLGESEIVLQAASMAYFPVVNFPH